VLAEYRFCRSVFVGLVSINPVFVEKRLVSMR